MRHALHAPRGRWVFEGEGGRVTVPVRGRLEVNHTGMIRDAAVAGLGVALLPRFAVAEALREGRLEVVLEGWRVPPPVGIYALFPAGRHEPGAVRALVEFLAAELPPRLEPREKGRARA
jgi:DNA-binding transcriptional LysR family regulator